jgi:hypothetical protein
MPNLGFEPSIRYRNGLLLPLQLYPPIRVPAGVSVRAPFFISAMEMQRLAPAQTIKVIAGLTTAEFSLCFANPSLQWRQVRSGGALTRWQFQGGKVSLNVLISVYVAEGFQSYNQALAVILELELLHVQDEIDIVSRFMPMAALRDQYVQRYLVEGREVDDPMYRRWFAGTGFQEWVHDSVWAPEHNRRGQMRDSGAEWESFRKRIDEFQRTSH